MSGQAHKDVKMKQLVSLASRASLANNLSGYLPERGILKLGGRGCPRVRASAARGQGLLIWLHIVPIVRVGELFVTRIVFPLGILLANISISVDFICCPLAVVDVPPSLFSLFTPYLQAGKSWIFSHCQSSDECNSIAKYLMQK